MACGLVASRFVHFGSTMILFGAGFYGVAFTPPTFLPQLEPILRRIGPPLTLLSLLSAIAWFAFVASDMAEGALDWDVLRAVAMETSFGLVWQAHLAILALLAIAIFRPGRRWRLPVALAGLAVASLALTGHAAMQGGMEGAAHRLNDAVHLLMAAIWIGGIPPFLVCLACWRRNPAERDALKSMMRFSSLGRYAVALLFLSGATNVALTTGALPWPPFSPYRAAIDAKIAVFLTMAVLALCNRYIFAPRAQRDAAAANALATGAVLELALGLAAVGLISALGISDPK